MKKLELKGLQMLSKNQMKKIGGGNADLFISCWCQNGDMPGYANVFYFNVADCLQGDWQFAVDEELTNICGAYDQFECAYTTSQCVDNTPPQ